MKNLFPPRKLKTIERGKEASSERGKNGRPVKGGTTGVFLSQEPRRL